MINIRNTLLKWIHKTTPSYNTVIRQAFTGFIFPVESLSYIVSFTVGETFVTFLIPSISIFIDPTLARYLMMIYAQNIIVCNILKNSLRLPRPWDVYNNCTLIESSYGFPSSHSACSLSTSFFILQYISFIFDFPISFVKTILITSLWAGTVGFSRLFLQRHSIIDVMGGYIIGIINSIWFNYMWKGQHLNRFFNRPIFAIQLLFISWGLLMIHPDIFDNMHLKYHLPNNILNRTVQESMCIAGCSIGSMLAIWRENVLPWLSPSSFIYTNYFIDYIYLLCFIIASKLVTNIIVNTVIPLQNSVQYNYNGNYMYIKLRWLISYILFSWILLDPITNLFYKRGIY